ncbi:hypothetical protein [Pseudomonas vanderleydeniana]|uniref:Uncharacterized protein n=1 Tax=Pseudomonas vanderleydeniana TaxID=2745495 RepID=A0A9E6TQQ2_9PSED|nr:hypothetical protein [Pseudomonas vanderleydeniana]QXI26726.1 hypothetical protein HU752_022740 [Pseudomonas vanderleydeniana]
MLKLNRMNSAVGYATPWRQRRGIGRANPYNVHHVTMIVSGLANTDKERLIFKIATVSPDNCSLAPNGQYFVVNQQLGAPRAQEKTRFEEIHRNTA